MKLFEEHRIVVALQNPVMDVCSFQLYLPFESLVQSGWRAGQPKFGFDDLKKNIPQPPCVTKPNHAGRPIRLHRA